MRLSLFLVLAFAAFTVAQDSRPLPSIRRLDAREAGVGEWIPNFLVTTKDGTTGTLTDRGGKLVLVIGDLIDAPIYSDEAKARIRTFAHGADGRFCLIAPTAPILGLLPGEVIVTDVARTVIYRGVFDDAPLAGKPHRRFVEDAVQAAIDRVPPTIPAATLAERTAPVPSPAFTDAELTWHNQISRLAQRRCESCHRQGAIGPFALSSIGDFKKRKAMIADVITDNVMPPWNAGVGSHAFQNDGSLSPREKAAFLQWIEKDCPEGDIQDSPIPRAWPTGWLIGKPDAIVQVPEKNKVPATGEVRYKYQWAKTDFAEDKWIQRMEIRCSQPQVVHHVLVFVEDAPKEGKRYRQGQGQEGLGGYFAGLVPGGGTSIYIEGRAKKLPKGATLKFQIHYTPNGKAVEDQTEIGLVFAKEPPEVEIVTKAATQLNLRIPPGDATYTQTATQRVREDGYIYSFAPHMHLRGKAFRYDIEFPDGKKIMPLDVPKFAFDWQFRYELTDPIFVPKGTRITATAVFDNSKANPYNPDPTATVRFGDQTSDEMLIGYFEFQTAAMRAN